jgi:hypothetical protein
MTSIPIKTILNAQTSFYFKAARLQMSENISIKSTLTKMYCKDLRKNKTFQE